jgi:predicted transport protein
MKLYNKNKNTLSLLREVPFKLERDIQNLFESQLSELLGLQLVKSEFSIKNRRIDTLAFDQQSKAFIIIEYKRSKSNSVVDQGFTYLNLMLENKADFIIEYNESCKATLQRKDVDWSQTRVVFVSTSFTENQKLATNFKDIAIELYEVRQYEGGIIAINPIKKSSSATSIQPLTEADESIRKVSREIKVYTEDDHLTSKSDTVIELYESFKGAIQNLSDNIEIVPRKKRISFKKDRIMCDIHIQKGRLKMWINLKKGTLDDPKQITRDVSSTGHWGNGDYELTITNTNNLEYIMSLAKQAL